MNETANDHYVGSTPLPKRTSVPDTVDVAQANDRQLRITAFQATRSGLSGANRVTEAKLIEKYLREGS